MSQSVETWSGKDRGDENFPVGSALIAHEINLLRETGAPRIWLTTDPASRAAAFYRRRGFAREALAADGGQEILVLAAANAGACGLRA